MSEDIFISQEVKKSGEINQVGVQIVNNGLSIQDALKIAFNIFEKYYPDLKSSALKTVEKYVKEELSKILNLNLCVPRPKIVIPALENASFTEEDNLRRMYAKLIASDMNCLSRKSIHPAYVEIINQMSSHDAMVFERINNINDSIPVARITFTFENKYLVNIMPHYYSPVFCDFNPWEVSMSLENLSRLNIINLFEGNVQSYDYSAFESDEFVLDRFEYAKQNNPTRTLKISISQFVIQGNDFGRRFAAVCINN